MQLAGDSGIIRIMKVLIDTDPGGDDAIALLWLASLARQGRITLQGVTTAGGNVGAEKTWRNACGLLRMCGLEDVPVAIGTDQGRVRDASEVHGDDGFGGLADQLPASGRASSAPDSATFLSAQLSANADSLTLLAVAPLSNLATVERRNPGMLASLQQLIVMGGSLGGGNVTPNAEFNFYFDAPAAATVLAARANTRLVTLETSTHLRLGGARVQAIVRGRERQSLAQVFRQLCAFMAQRDLQFNPTAKDGGFPVHDAATVAWLACPELFESRTVELVLDSEPGQLQGRLLEAAGGVPARVAMEVSAEQLLDQLGADLSWLFDDLDDQG